MPLIQYAQFEPIAIETTRITEASDTRITEAGDTRITNDISSNAGDSSLVANATLIPYAKEAYYHYSGSWKPMDIYVKWGGIWTTNFVMYKNIGGIWKRSY
jgi:hypothetical protein